MSGSIIQKPVPTGVGLYTKWGEHEAYSPDLP